MGYHNHLRESTGSTCEIGCVNPLKFVVDFLAKLLEVHCVHFYLSELLLNASKGPHCGLDLLNDVFLAGNEGLSLKFELIHLAAMLHSKDFVFLALDFPLLGLLNLNLALFLLLLLPLDDSDPFVEFGEEMGQLCVNFVSEVAEVDAGLVVDSLEEHYRGKILLKVLDFTLFDFPLQNVDDSLLLGSHDLFGQLGDLFLEFDDAVYVPAQILHLDRVDLDDFCADDFDLVVGALGDLIDEIADGQFCALGEDILDVPALDEGHALYHIDDAVLLLARLEGARFFGCLPEQQDALLVHEEVQEFLLLVQKEGAKLVSQFGHLANFLVVVLD